MYKLRVRTISPILHRSQIERLAKVVSISGICDQQQDILNNEDISLYGKLWKRIEDGRRHQKERKGRKSNGICRETKKSTRKSRGSVEKDIGGDEKIYR